MDVNLRLQGDRNKKKYIYAVVLMILILFGYFLWAHIREPVSVISPQKTISAAREENVEYKAAVKTAAEKTKRDSSVLREENKKYVIALSPDAVASAVTSELTVFQSEQTSSEDKKTQPDNEVVFYYVPEGWQSAEPGYWANEDSGRLILEGLRTWRMDRDNWETAYNAQYETDLEYAESTAAKLNTLEEQFKRDKREIMKTKCPGLGIFAGPSYTSGGDLQLAVGIGVVWRFWP